MVAAIQPARMTRDRLNRPRWNGTTGDAQLVQMPASVRLVAQAATIKGAIGWRILVVRVIGIRYRAGITKPSGKKLSRTKTAMVIPLIATIDHPGDRCVPVLDGL